MATWLPVLVVIVCVVLLALLVLALTSRIAELEERLDRLLREQPASDAPIRSVAFRAVDGAARWP
jgi:hypothetical protein